MSSFLRRHWPILLILAAALGYRLYLTTIYYGWEESDYGNLAMARGVLDSHFTHYDMRHLPLYYGLSAAVLALVGDAIVATEAVSMAGGMAAIGASYLIALRLFDRPVALTVAAALAIQPEFALYSSTALREPLYAALWIGGLLLALQGRTALATASMGGAFLTRFDALFTGIPLVLFHQISRPGGWRQRARHLAITLAVAALFVSGWSIYCGVVHGDFIFFRSTVEVNVATGGAQEIRTAGAFIRQGLETVVAMLTSILPRKLGWPLWIGALAAAPLLGRRAWKNRDLRAFLFAWLINTAFWFAVAFFAQHEPDHNLYWKWMYVLVPFWTTLGVYSWVHIARRLPPRWIGALAVIAVGGTLLAFQQETQRQIDMSSRLYRPQVEIGEFIEGHVPPGTQMILDNIPACYLDRRHHEYRLHSWFDIEIKEGDPDSLARWIEAHEAQYVLWFKEDWTTAPRKAPYLARVATHRIGPFILTPIRHESEYGFIFYEVERAPDDPSFFP